VQECQGPAGRLHYGCGINILPTARDTTGTTMASINKEDHARDVQRTLDAVFGHVPAAREAFPELAAVHARLPVHGIKALAETPAMDRDEMLAKLKSLLPSFGSKQLQAVVDVLTKIDRRSARRAPSEATQVSTPAMFAAEVSMDEFIQALEAHRR
jgi:hypothetical protein